MGLILINLLTILVIVAVLYLFQKYVTPIDSKVVGILIFIVCAILIIYWVTGHSLLFWKR